MSIRRLIVISLISIALAESWKYRQPLLFALHWFSDPNAVIKSIQEYGVWGAVVLFVLFILQVFFALIPGQALMVASGYIYGFTGGMLITWTSLVVGGQAAFWLASRYGRPSAEKWVSPLILDR